MPHCTACCMARVPGTRPPISSVRRRRLSWRGEGCRAVWITWLTALLSAGGLAAKLTKVRMQTQSRALRVRIWQALEMKSGKSAKRNTTKDTKVHKGSHTFLRETSCPWWLIGFARRKRFHLVENADGFQNDVS